MQSIIVFCIVLSQKFNIMSTLFVQQLAIVPQKIDSREGFVLIQKVASSRMLKNEYLLQQTVNCTIFRAFLAK